MPSHITSPLSSLCHIPQLRYDAPPSLLGSCEFFLCSNLSDKGCSSGAMHKFTLHPLPTGWLFHLHITSSHMSKNLRLVLSPCGHATHAHPPPHSSQQAWLIFTFHFVLCQIRFTKKENKSQLVFLGIGFISNKYKHIYIKSI